MASFLRLAVIVLMGLAVAGPGDARLIPYAQRKLPRIDEVPIERLIANLKRNAQRLPPDYLWAQIGRVHLLAYIRDSSRLPVHRDNPESIWEGDVVDCARLDDYPKIDLNPGDRCANWRDRDWRVVPANAHEAKRRPSTHVAAAIDALGRAKALNPKDDRTHLSLAFAFDRALRLNEARAELRPLVHWGIRRTRPLPGYPLDTIDWATYTVFSEAADHLARIPEDGADRQDAATLKRQLGSSHPPLMISPIFVPLKRGVAFDDLVNPNSSAAFDFTGQGPATRMGWVKRDAAWLVWDPKRKGKIVSGFQLFGSVSWMAFWTNGYHALGSLDDNADGKIAGRELDGLALWRDRNENGISEPGEVSSVRSHRIVALSYAHARARNDLWISRAGVTFVGGETRPTYDWVVRPAPLVVGARR